MNRVTVISTSFPTSSIHSGQEAAGSFVYDFVQELSRNTEVNVVAPGQTNCRVELEGISVSYFAASSLPLSQLNPTNPTRWPAIIRTLKSGQRAVLDIVMETNPQHILALWALPSGYWAKTAGELTGTPYSVWALGSDIWSLGTIPLVRNTLRSVLRNSSNCFADGHKLAKDVTALSGKPCCFLPSCRKLSFNAVKILAASPPYKLAFLGRWHKNKGIDLLFESLNLLKKEDWDRIQEIRINGGGPVNQMVHTEGRKLKEKGYPVSIGGYLNAADAASFYHWADFLLIPSRVESIPVVFSDAMQSNCPIITMPVGDLKNLIDFHHVGVCADSASSSAFSAALSKALLLPPVLYKNGMKNALNDFSIPNIVKQIENLLL